MRAKWIVRTFLVSLLAIKGIGLFNCPLLAQEVKPREALRPDEMTDLVAAGLSPSVLYPLPGEVVDVTAGVRNRASHNERNVIVALFAGGTRIASEAIDLNAGETRTLHFSWRPKEEGAITLTLRIDPDQTHMELDRRDNQVSLDVVVARQPAAGADFAASDLQFVTVEGKPSLIRAMVQNSGEVAGSAPLVLQVDGRTAARRLVALRAGERLTVEIPWSSEEFRGRLSAEINPRFRAKEKKTDDNLLSRDLRPSVGLVVEGLSISAAQFDPKRPRQVTISFRILNAGRDAITETFRTAIFPGAIRSDNAQPLDTYYLTTNGLAAGSSIYVSRTIISPLGEFDVRVEADADHKIKLANGTRNIATAKFKNPTPSTGRWVSIGPRLITSGPSGFRANGRVTAIAIDPTSPSTVYVGAFHSGVWKTSDGGASWAPITDSLPTLDVAAIAVDPSMPSRIYVALAGSGVFRSTDAGISWTQISGDLQAEVRWGVLLVNPTSPNVIYVASAAGVYRSGDSGGTWQLSKSGGEATDLVMDPTNPNILYAALFGNGIYRTNTGGAGGDSDWVKLTAGLPSSDIAQITLALCRGTPTALYAGYSRLSGFQLYRTTNAGSSWSLQSTAPFSGLFNDAIGVDSGDPNTVYITGVGIYRSTDGGANFAPLSGTHGDHHAFANDPVTAGLIYVGDDGGIYQSTNRGDSWTFWGEGISNAELYDIADAATQSSLVIGGTQDNGNIKYDGSSTVWNQMDGFGDGATVDIDPTNAQILYAMGQGIDSLAQSTDGGNSFMNIAGGLPAGVGATGGCAVYNTYFQVHPSQPTTLLASPVPGVSPPGPCGALYQTTNPQPPGFWSLLFRPPSGSIVRSAVDPSVNLDYAASSDGRIYTGPGGANWQTVFTHPSGSSVSDVRIDAEDPATVYVAFGGTGAGRVYRLRRSSAAPTSMTATDITSDLPSGLTIGQVFGLASGGALAVDRLLPLTIYAGTSRGVYCGRTSDGGNTWWWTPYNNGMPPADVTDLEVHPTTGVLRAATYGRSAYEVNTDSHIGSLLGASGRITFLRVNDLGTGFGPPYDFLDAEVIVLLDAQPGKGFGFQLRSDQDLHDHAGMLDLLRAAFRKNQLVHLDYIRTGFRNGRIIRVAIVQ
jgi:photosystem II stability/assembly factor-like uncharacterized protein